MVILYPCIARNKPVEIAKSACIVYPKVKDLQEIDYARPVVLVELDEDLPGVANLLARTFNNE